MRDKSRFWKLVLWGIGIGALTSFFFGLGSTQRQSVREKFLQIKEGMTYLEVSEILEELEMEDRGHLGLVHTSLVQTGYAGLTVHFYSDCGSLFVQFDEEYRVLYTQIISSTSTRPNWLKRFFLNQILANGSN